MKVTATIRVMSEIDALRTAVVLALERLCFASADRYLDEHPVEPTVTARVAFTGPRTGSVSIAMPRATLAALCETLAPPDVEILHDDVLGELANIICGNVVPRIFGPTETYMLAPPELGPPPPGPDLATAVVAFDCGWVVATLHGEAS